MPHLAKGAFHGCVSLTSPSSWASRRVVLWWKIGPFRAHLLGHDFWAMGLFGLCGLVHSECPLYFIPSDMKARDFHQQKQGTKDLELVARVRKTGHVGLRLRSLPDHWPQHVRAHNGGWRMIGGNVKQTFFSASIPAFRTGFLSPPVTIATEVFGATRSAQSTCQDMQPDHVTTGEFWRSVMDLPSQW